MSAMLQMVLNPRVMLRVGLPIAVAVVAFTALILWAVGKL